MADQISSLTPNLDTRVSLGLQGTVDSTNYILEVVETHNHTPQYCYGSSSAVAGGNFSRGSLDPFTINGGNNAYAEEIQLHDGTVIESGSTIKQFDMNTIYCYSIGTANRLMLLEFYTGVQNTGIVCTSDKTTDKITKSTHGLSDGTKLMFSPTANLPAGLNSYTVYYVVNKGTNDFEVSLTSGGAKVDITGDAGGTINYHTLNQTLLTETYVGFASTNADSYPFVLRALRSMCNNCIWVRAKAKDGTNNVTCLFGLHIYTG